MKRATSIIASDTWPKPRVDYEKDAKAFSESMGLDENQQQAKIPVDPTGNFEKSYSVYYDGKDPYDCYLTKVDLSKGIYGEYLFYKMQLLHDSNRDLYIVFTRWGRIGEDGMNQRSPFNSAEEAVAEFKKVFKQKTGNSWDYIEFFERQDRKYNLTKVHYSNADYKDYLVPFDLDKAPPSKLSEPVQDVLKEIAKVTLFQRALSNFGIDNSMLPFSAIKKEMIVKARQIL